MVGECVFFRFGKASSSIADRTGPSGRCRMIPKAKNGPLQQPKTETCFFPISISFPFHDLDLLHIEFFYWGMRACVSWLCFYSSNFTFLHPASHWILPSARANSSLWKSRANENNLFGPTHREAKKMEHNRLRYRSRITDAQGYNLAANKVKRLMLWQD